MSDYDVTGLQNLGPFDGTIVPGYSLKFNINETVGAFSNGSFCAYLKDCSVCHYQSGASYCSGETFNTFFTPSPNYDGYNVSGLGYSPGRSYANSSIQVICSNITQISGMVEGQCPWVQVLFKTPFGCPLSKGVALVGDRTYYAYPTILKALAGSGYEITDYAVGLTTVLTSEHGIDPSYQSYRDTAAYREVLSSGWSHLVLLLGTNDGDPRNFPSDQPEAFEEDYKALVQAFAKSHPAGKIFICTTPYSDEPDLDGNFREKVEERYIRPMLENVSHDLGLQIVDLATASQNDPNFLGPDGLHPSQEGAELLARVILDALDGGKRR